MTQSISTNAFATVVIACGILVIQGLLPPLSTAAENVPGATSSFTPPATAAEALREAATRQAMADRERLLATIADLESREEVYGPAASEAYLSYGNALHVLELDEEALQSYGKALQALRVSNGLYDLQQIPILRQQAVALEAVKNWEEVDATRHLIYHVSMKQLPAGAPPRFDALLELARWKFKAAEEDLLSNNIDSSYQSSELYRNEIHAMEQAEPWQERSIQLGLLYLELAAVEYQQARRKYALPLSAYLTSQQRSVSQLQCQSIRLPDGRSTQVCQNVELPNMEYYMGPTRKKNQEVAAHLDNMKDAVMSAYELLQQDTAFTADRDELLVEVHKLTNAYNAFSGDDVRR